MNIQLGASDDPFAHFLRPPAGETNKECAARLLREASEKAVNDAINLQLKKERAEMSRGTIKILLLGQAESGKSTTLKNFRMLFAKDTWDAERASWKAVIYLNIIKSVITIVKTIQAELDGDPVEHPESPEEATTTPPLPILTDENTSEIIPISPSLAESHRQLSLHLPSLQRAFCELQQRLGEGASEENEVEIAGTHGELTCTSEPQQSVSRRGGAQREFCVRKIQEALAHAVEASQSVADMPTEVLLDSFDSINAVWGDDTVRAVLKKRHAKLQEMVPSFLSDLTRIVQRSYIPSDNDVIRSRLRTVGVQEYRINITRGQGLGSNGRQRGLDWLLYDVGGSRTMRQAWIPYFDDVQAIIFLAPVSCFDERLIEDNTVNRLEDSFILWQHICSSRLLSRASLILFLNKCDLLRRKLRTGARLADHLPGFGTRSNDVGTAVKYLKSHFKGILKDNSPVARNPYIYATTVTDTAATAVTVSAVKDSILRDYLVYANFL